MPLKQDLNHKLLRIRIFAMDIIHSYTLWYHIIRLIKTAIPQLLYSQKLNNSFLQPIYHACS